MKHSAQPKTLRIVAVGAVLALVAAACGGGSSSTKKSTTSTANANNASTAGGKVTVHPLAVSKTADGSEGSSHPVTVRLSNSSDKKLRVGFTEDEVAGTGDQWRAAGWSATTVATLLTGAALTNREVTFDVTGQIDGPSAGALLTVAVLALTRGDKLKSDITMTGTINPDGTVGPVGGIPYKVDGVKQAKKTRMLVPTGQRNSADDSGELVDVVDAGRRKGITVTEVADVYAAYKAFTGKTLPRPTSSGEVELDNQTYARLKAKADSWLAKYNQSVGQFKSLDPAIQADENLQSIATQADTYEATASKLKDEGLQAGAWENAVLAAMFANAAVVTGQQITSLATQGVEAYVSNVRGSASISGEIQALVDELKTFTPKTVSDGAALISAYSYAVDAISLSDFADNVLTNAGNATDPAEVLRLATVGSLYYEFAGTLAEAAKDQFDIGRNLEGAPLDKALDLKTVAEFFRRSAEANLNAFNTVVLAPAAKEANVNEDVAKANFADNDLTYGLAVSSQNVISGLDKYFGDAKSSAYAELGGSLSLYSRTAGLLAKYYSLGEVENLEVVGIQNDKALAAGLSLAQSQLQGTVGLLRSKKVNPALVVAAYESGGIDREGEASDKLTALETYWGGFVGGRILAYLGGFPTQGLK